MRLPRAVLLFVALAAVSACRSAPETAYVELDNPFLVATVESFRLSAKNAMERRDVSSLANQVFLLKRTLPVAWAAVVDSTGTVLMHSDPKAIATVVTDTASVESLAYLDPHQPLVRRLWSDDRRPVLDLTLPITFGEDGHQEPGGYVRVGFFVGARVRAWAAPPSNAPHAASPQP